MHGKKETSDVDFDKLIYCRTRATSHIKMVNHLKKTLNKLEKGRVYRDVVIGNPVSHYWLRYFQILNVSN